MLTPIPVTPLRSIGGPDLLPSKKSSWHSGGVWFHKFVAEYKQTKPDFVFSTIHDCPASSINKELMEHFAAYLEDNCNTWNTARLAFGAVKNQLQKRLTELVPFFAECNQDWQKDIRKHFVRKCSVNRVPIVNHHIPVRDVDNLHLCKFMFEADRHEECALQALDWSNCGRISEGPTLHWCDVKVHQEILSTKIA